MRFRPNPLSSIQFTVVLVIFLGAPFHIQIGRPGIEFIAPNLAIAKGGSGKGDDGGGSDNSGSGSGGNSGSGSSNSGSGSGNSGSGHGGSGGDDGGSENSGSGNNNGSRDNDDSGDSKDSSGKNNGPRDGNSGSQNTGSGQPRANKSAILRIILTTSGVEIRYVDGSREEIRNRRYSFTKSNGQVTVSRRATGADLARLRARASGISIENVRRPTNNNPTIIVTGVKTGNNRWIVTYSNGWSEEISNGTYMLNDQYGRAAVKRPATAGDIKRMRKTAGN